MKQDPDLHETTFGFDPMEEAEDLLADIDGTDVFDGDDFPPLPDFSCMSASSSSSSHPAPVKTIPFSFSSSASTSSSSASSSSASAPWAIIKSDAEEDQVCAAPPPMSCTSNDRNIVNSLEVMEDFGCMDLIETDDIWDPSAVYGFENPSSSGFQQEMKQQAEDGEIGSSEDPAMLFLEWLKSNRDSISAEDLRSIKLKRSTVECAARRLGGGQRGMKQLLKLILEWVQNHHLHKRRLREQNSNPNPTLNPTFASSSQWMMNPPVSIATNPAPGVVAQPSFPADPFMNGQVFATPSEYRHVLDATQSWTSSQFSNIAANYSGAFIDNIAPAPFIGYGNQNPYQYCDNGGGLARMGSSATKEARKKRMARQRRTLSYHRRHNQQQSANIDQKLGGDRCASTSLPNPGNDWVCWASPEAVQPPSANGSSMQTQTYHRQIIPDKRQGCKPEKNLKFLLQKVLKQSDVGNLGRIVLPKKEAETHLPELEARDGISIAMEDIGTSCVWNMRYRFWPNNKSRMYLLENTGDFVRANGLQEGDFIVIYSDIKCGKYLIRGVKVRQPGLKYEAKKAGKAQRNQFANSTAAIASASSSTSPLKV